MTTAVSDLRQCVILREKSDDRTGLAGITYSTKGEWHLPVVAVHTETMRFQPRRKQLGGLLLCSADLRIFIQFLCDFQQLRQNCLNCLADLSFQFLFHNFTL